MEVLVEFWGFMIARLPIHICIIITTSYGPWFIPQFVNHAKRIP